MYGIKMSDLRPKMQIIKAYKRSILKQEDYFYKYDKIENKSCN